MQEPEFQCFTTSDNWFKHQVQKVFDLIMYSKSKSWQDIQPGINNINILLVKTYFTIFFHHHVYIQLCRWRGGLSTGSRWSSVILDSWKETNSVTWRRFDIWLPWHYINDTGMLTVCYLLEIFDRSTYPALIPYQEKSSSKDIEKMLEEQNCQKNI